MRVAIAKEKTLESETEIGERGEGGDCLGNFKNGKGSEKKSCRGVFLFLVKNAFLLREKKKT